MRRVIRRVASRIGPFKVQKDEAVSPVIATILMVAVTVVLAAAVYLLVSYYNPGPVPLYGTLTEQPGNSSNSTTLLLTLAQPSILKDPSDFHMQILNTSSSSTGAGWTIQNVTISNPDGTVLYMNTFTSSGNVWTSNGAIPAKGASSIQSGCFITIVFHTTGKPIVMSDLKVQITYTGTTGSISTQLS